MRPADDVAGPPDVGDHVAPGDLLAGAQALGVFRQVAVEEQVAAGRVLLVQRNAAPLLPPHLHDFPVGCREDRSALGRADVDGQVLLVLSARIQEGVFQTAGVHALDRDLDAGQEQAGQVHVFGPEGRLGRLRPQERADRPGDPRDRIDRRRRQRFGHVRRIGIFLVGLVLMGLDDGVPLDARGLREVVLLDRQERPVGLGHRDGHPFDDDGAPGVLVNHVPGLLVRHGTPACGPERPRPSSCGPRCGPKPPRSGRPWPPSSGGWSPPRLRVRGRKGNRRLEQPPE